MANESDPLCAGITDEGAKQVMHEMYVDFMNAAPGGKDHGMFLNMKSAFLHAEEENFQQALTRIGRENAIRLEGIMNAVQQQGYGSDAADLFYMKWAARAVKNSKTPSARTTESLPIKVRKSKVESFREAVEESAAGGSQDVVGFSYDLTQGLLGDIEPPIELYFVHPSVTEEILQQAKQQGAEAIAVPCPVVAGFTMDLNVALVAAGEDGVVFQRKFSKEQIVGGYGLSVGFKGAEFEYEKEIMVLADEVNGPDDAHLVFDLDGEVYNDPNETPDDAQKAVETDTESPAATGPVSESFPPQGGEVDQEGPEAPAPEIPENGEPGDGLSLSVADSSYGKLATIETAQAGDWLKTLRISPEGQQMAANSKQRVEAALAQNKALAEKFGGISPDAEGEEDEAGTEEPEAVPEQENSPEPEEEQGQK
jgi:hypothetical protein